MSIKITKMSNKIENAKPNIKITKLETSDVLKDNDSIITPLYGKIKIANTVDDNYVYFDTVDGYNLFVDIDGNNTIAIKEESTILETENADPIKEDIKKITDKYELNLNEVNWSNADNAIMIKSDNLDTLNIIYNDYINSKVYNPEFITNDVLFLNKSGDIKLEDGTDDLLDKLNDGAVKEIASKSGVKLSGSESKDQLKGIIKGAIANQN